MATTDTPNEMPVLSSEELEKLTEQMKHPDFGVGIKDRKYFLKKYPKCFKGNRAVKWFVIKGVAKNKAEAIQVGQQLVDGDYIHHVSDDHNFEDAPLFYRFRDDELSKNGPSVAALKKN
eukprot:TRINITY_DN2674_c0_g1_i1.p1 TRINITY_DN2674_c0_g1~~TRINITY_DN2674_c0_g1_i1.p1  ORF type:complete len:119 (-),score=20.61 TRINITY_DN2674_c0_g1_i1:136-492(-)